MTAIVKDLLVDSLTDGRSDQTAQMFHEHGSPAPTLVWDPSEVDMPHPLMRSFFRRYHELKGDERGLTRELAKAQAFEGLEDWLMILDAEPGGTGFRYSFYGSGIAENYGTDMTGRRVADFGGHISDFFIACYHAVQNRGQVLLTEHEPPRQVFVRRWYRLLVPVFDADAVCGFVVINLPDNEFRAGLDLISDPVMVLDDSRNICFANHAARTLFDFTAGSAWMHKPLYEATGLVLDTTKTALELVAARKAEDELQITFQNTVADRFHITVSGALHRNRAFYVLQLRLMSLHDPIPL